MHYSQKRRYYFFIAIAKFKTILSYYPRWRKLSTPTLANFQSLPKLIAPPMLNLRSTFAQPSLMIAPHLCHTCATLAPHLHHTCATHFGKLSEFAKVNQLPRWRKFPPQCLSFVTYSAVPARRLSFDQGSLKVRPRWRKLAVCAQFKIHNSKFIILPHSPLIFP